MLARVLCKLDNDGKTQLLVIIEMVRTVPSIIFLPFCIIPKCSNSIVMLHMIVLFGLPNNQNLSRPIHVIQCVY